MINKLADESIGTSTLHNIINCVHEYHIKLSVIKPCYQKQKISAHCLNQWLGAHLRCYEVGELITGKKFCSSNQVEEMLHTRKDSGYCYVLM